MGNQAAIDRDVAKAREGLTAFQQSAPIRRCTHGKRKEQCSTPARYYIINHLSGAIQMYLCEGHRYDLDVVRGLDTHSEFYTIRTLPTVQRREGEEEEGKRQGSDDEEEGKQRKFDESLSSRAEGTPVDEDEDADAHEGDAHEGDATV